MGVRVRSYVPVHTYEFYVRIIPRARMGVVAVLRWCLASGAVVVAYLFLLRTETRPVIAPCSGGISAVGLSSAASPPAWVRIGNVCGRACDGEGGEGGGRGGGGLDDYDHRASWQAGQHW